MRLHREARKWYVVTLTADPPLASVTVQASFDDAETWVDGTAGVEGQGGVLGWGWLVAGPDFADDLAGLNPVDADATLAGTTNPLFRIKEDPTLEIDAAPELITVWR